MKQKAFIISLAVVFVIAVAATAKPFLALLITAFFAMGWMAGGMENGKA